jgi:hypothetical protein
MRGSERSRAAAVYSANRALFLLLLTSPHWLNLKSTTSSSEPRLFDYPRSVS